ncbi:MAG: TetR/AcrR family transcriptional regulator [Pseudomonadales bacterium]|nr:TetR/AcrR family transcriptional regulator [Pseudomonadales bacterium]
MPRGKREEVLDVASNYFLVNGYEGTSINVMAREAGISKESIYRYFGSKEDLFKAVVARELEVYRRGMENTESDHGLSLAEALQHVAEAALKVLTTDRALALRRLIFQMAANGSAIGKYYYEVGPRIAYLNLKKIFDQHAMKSTFSSEKLSVYFISQALHTIMLERECGLLKKVSQKEIQKRSQTVVDDFILAYFDLGDS